MDEMVKNKTTKQSWSEPLERIVPDSLGEHPPRVQGGGRWGSGSLWLGREGCGPLTGAPVRRLEEPRGLRVVVVIAV